MSTKPTKIGGTRTGKTLTTRLAAAVAWLLLAGRAAALDPTSFSVQLTDGTLVKGEVVSWDNEDLSVRSALGTLIIHRDKLTPKTIEELSKFTYNPEKATREQLIAKVSELEETVGSLRRDNAALRAQLGGGGAEVDKATGAGGKGGKYWISKSGKRHNENCRYYKTGTGEEGTAREGEPCKVCGG